MLRTKVPSIILLDFTDKLFFSVRPLVWLHKYTISHKFSTKKTLKILDDSSISFLMLINIFPVRTYFYWKTQNVVPIISSSLHRHKKSRLQVVDKARAFKCDNYKYDNDDNC